MSPLHYISRLISRTAPSKIIEVTSQALAAYTFGLSLVVSAASSFRSTYYIITTELDKIADLAQRYLDFTVQTILR